MLNHGSIKQHNRIHFPRHVSLGSSFRFSLITEDGGEVVAVAVEEELWRRDGVGDVAELLGVVERGAAREAAEAGVWEAGEGAALDVVAVAADVQADDLVHVEVVREDGVVVGVVVLREVLCNGKKKIKRSENTSSEIRV